MVIITIPHPPQSLHQVPCDVWMFLRQKEKLRDCRFQDVHEMKEAVSKALATYTLDFGGLPACLHEVAGRYNKCVELGSPTSRVTEVSCFSEINYCIQ